MQQTLGEFEPEIRFKPRAGAKKLRHSCRAVRLAAIQLQGKLDAAGQMTRAIGGVAHGLAPIGRELTFRPESFTRRAIFRLDRSRFRVPQNLVPARRRPLTRNDVREGKVGERKARVFIECRVQQAFGMRQIAAERRIAQRFGVELESRNDVVLTLGSEPGA